MRRRALCSIVPPFILRNIATRGDEEDRAMALATRRKRRTAFDAMVNEAYEGASRRTYDYFREVHGRSSVDDRGMRLDSTVHFGKYFRRFTSALDVIAHELTHGVTEYAAGFAFSGQGGALAEHYSDVFGLMVKQHAAGKSTEWILGRDLFTDRVHGEGIRSFAAPGTAFDDPILGKDPQPSHMRDYVKTSADDRGVHVNSGIPNHAFYRVATLLGGKAWETAGRIWYRALVDELGPRSRFQHCADATWRAAGTLFGTGSEPQHAVLAGWRAVGVEVADGVTRPRMHFDPPDAAAELPQLA
jgi:Zn-dependent metalloprotease